MSTGLRIPETARVIEVDACDRHRFTQDRKGRWLGWPQALLAETTPMKYAARTITRDPAWLGPAIHPGEMLLEEYLKPLGLTQAQAARQLGMSVNRLNELVLGKRGVTADTALRLARRFETTPQR